MKEKNLSPSEKRLEELTFLYQISSSMHTLNLNEILNLILEAVTKGIGFDRARLYIYDEENNVLRLKMSVGLEKDEVHDIALPINKEKSIVARCFLERKPHVIQDAQHDPHVNPELVKRFNIKSFAAAPLLARDKVKGVVTADNLYSNRIISDENLRSLVTFANQAGLAMENAEIYDRLKNFNAELKKEIKQTTDKLLKAQEELIRQERLAALGELAAGIAHEIRNPLTSIKILVSSLFSELPENIKKSRDVKVINAEMDRLNTIITQFLEYAKPQEPTFKKINLYDIALDTVILATPKIKKQNVTPIINIPKKFPAMKGDARQLKQVFLNFILNAVDAMPQGGEIAITAAMEKDKIKNTDSAKITIKDTGVGISEENITKLFMPFFSTKKEGVGLGLSMAQKIISNHGGRIKVESKLNKGTSFIIYLPVQ